MNKINNLKKKQRNKYLRIRKEINKKNIFKLNLEIINNLFNTKIFQNIKIISSFFFDKF